MALVKSMTSAPPARAVNSWNPFRCSSAALPTQVLLMAKLLALSLLLTGHVRLLPDPFLPFIPGLDQIAPPEIFQKILQTVFLGSALALLFNRFVRASAFVLGLTMLIAVLSSKAYYGNNKIFTGLMLLFAGLYDPRTGLLFLRWQIVIVYFGAGLNKLLDPDWQSGVFFQHWAGTRLQNPLYLALAGALPGFVAAKIFCWGTILVELGLAGIFLLKKLIPLAIWISVLFHASLLLFTGSTFTLFFYAMQSAMLVFAFWPRNTTVIYDGDCGICDQTRRFMERLDLEGMFAWRASQTGIGERHGITQEDLQRRIFLVADDRIYSGFRAFQMMLLWNPLTYFAIAILLAAPPADWTLYRRILVALLLAFFLPLFRPAGEAVYNYVARNRHRFSACEIRERKIQS
jgi:predicted DCC family thiol-disulfide oxidoreductase YuxK